MSTPHSPRGTVYGVALNDPADIAALGEAVHQPPYKTPPQAPVLYLKPRNTWAASGDVVRFLAVLVIATPCPLLIGIPVVIISSISLAAKREIIIKNPAILETIGKCRTAIFDKTGTLTYGRPSLTSLTPVGTYDEKTVLTLIASLERYSRHPLSTSIVAPSFQST